MSGDFYSNPAKMFAAMQAANPNFPIPELPPLVHVKTKAATLSEAIFKDWHELHQILELHEDTIRKRWMKKNIRQRQAILQAAYPSIPSQHRPDFHALSQESLSQRRKSSRFRDVYLLPELNLEDLSKPRNLLLLLNSRGRNLPDVFIYTDLEKVELGRTSQAVIPPYIGDCTMYLTGQTDAQSYGRIVGWDDGPDVFSDMMCGIGMQPGEGLVALEAQQKMLSFLLKCAKSIIHDLSLDGEPVPEPPPLEEPVVDPELSSIAAYATGTSYRVPIQFDIHHLKRLAQAKIDQAQDHLWSLREDPSYFRDVALEYSEHRLENLPTAQGGKHPKLNTPGLWEEIFVTIVIHAYCNVLIWSILKQQLDELEALRKDLEADIANNHTLPEVYETFLCQFQHFLNQWMKGPIQDLKNGAYGSPPLRKYFVRLPQDPRTTQILVHSKPLAQATTRPKIIVLIDRLFDEEQCHLMGRHNVLDELDRVLRTENKERDSVTPWVLSHLMEMGIFSEFLRQLDFHQPRIGFNAGLEERDGFDRFNTAMKPLAQFFIPLTSDLLGVASLGTPVPGRFGYPIHKKLSEVTVRQIRQAEAELDAFWAKVDSVMKRRTGKTPNEMLKDYVGQREVERMPEWVKPPEHVSPRPSVTAVKDKFARLDLQQSTESTLGKDDAPTAPKEKTKTRGIASLGDETTTQNAPTTAHPIGPTSHIMVSGRVYQTFSRVFYTPSADRVPGEVAWTDFLHAMTSAGCSAKRLMGSAWMFSFSHQPKEEVVVHSVKSASDVNEPVVKSIIFHEPHPAANIPFHHVRKHGRRLTRRWGWNIDTFAIAIA